MAELNVQINDRTLIKIDEMLEKKGPIAYKIVPEEKKEKPRNYLGMSQIGDPCWRKLFYIFRKAEKRIIPALNVKAIEDGYTQEALMAIRLGMLPNIELVTTDPNNPDEQIAFSLLLDHFRGHCDGMIHGIEEAPKTWHVWEHKSVQDKKFNELIKIRDDKGEKNALKEWDIIYYAQAQIYMHCSQTERHFLTVTPPGGRHYISIRTEYNRKYAEGLITKAKSIIFDNWDLPPRLSEKREYYLCKWCEFQENCHDGKIPEINCRTCRYSEPIQDGKTKCLHNEKNLENFMACNEHVYNPALVSAKLIEHQKDCCIYQTEKNITFANCSLAGIPELKGELDEIYTSEQLRNEVEFINNIKKNNSVQQIKKKKKPWE